MTESEVIKLLAMLAAAYPNMKEVNEIQVTLWHDCLKDIDSRVALAAIKKNILESPFPPTIADIRKQVTEVTALESEKLDGATAWGEAMKAIKHYGYYREKEALESMSPMTAKVVKYMGWEEICHSEKIDVVRGQFLKMYEALSKRANQERLLPTDFKEKMGEIASSQKAIASLAESMDMRKTLE